MIAKLKLEIYKDPAFTAKERDIVLQINPEDYKEEKSISYEKRGDHPPLFKEQQQNNISLDFVIDGTGVIPSEETVVVGDKIKELEQYLYEPFIEGRRKRPYFVQIRWGKLFFQGRLEKMNIHYTLFKPNGEPLRAKVSLSFVRTIPPRATINGKPVPAPTEKIIIVKEGDTLANLCAREYGDPSLDTDIAKKNGLTKLRGLKPGQQLIFTKLI